jgi:hypothetical protein
MPFASHYDTTQQKLPQSAVSGTITVVTLRDPVKRLISAFNHLNEHKFLNGRSYAAVKLIFQEWLHSLRQRSIVNQATLQLAGRCKVVMGRASPIRNALLSGRVAMLLVHSRGTNRLNLDMTEHIRDQVTRRNTSTGTHLASSAEGGPDELPDSDVTTPCQIIQNSLAPLLWALGSHFRII